MSDASLDIFNPDDWVKAAKDSSPEELANLALPGPPLTEEEFWAAIREGDESGIYEGDPIAEIRRERAARQQGKAAA